MRRAPLRLLIGPVIVIAAALLIGNIVVFAAWTAPRWSARLGVAGGAGGVAEARARVEPALRRVRDTYGRLERADEDLEDFRARLITEQGGAELLGMLDAAGDDVGIDLDDATLQYVPLEELGVIQLGITFPVTGTYESVRALLDELVTLPTFLLIDGVGLQTFSASSVAAQAASGIQIVRVDLAVSVFLDDPDIADRLPGPATSNGRPVVSERQLDALRAALDDGDPDDIADAVVDSLEALPALPVDPAALIVELDALEAPPDSSQPRRNLFSIVLPQRPEPEVVAQQPEMVVEPEPVLPVRLVGVLIVDGRWHASVTDENHVFIVQAGDTLPNGVEIIDVGEDYAEVNYRDRRTVLRLEGNRP